MTRRVHGGAFEKVTMAPGGTSASVALPTAGAAARDRAMPGVGLSMAATDGVCPSGQRVCPPVRWPAQFCRPIR